MVHFSLMFLPEWREFPTAPYLEEIKIDDSSHLDVVEIARVVYLCVYCGILRHMNIITMEL